MKAIEEAVDLYRRLNLPADLAGSLNNASNRYSNLAQAAEGVEERRELLERSVKAIEQAVKIRRRLNLPADLAMSLGNRTNVLTAQAQLAEDEAQVRAFRVKAAQTIDEAISLFEQVGQNFLLVRAYPHGVRTHLPLMSQRPESLQKFKEYAAKAASLLRTYGKESEAARYEDLLRRLEKTNAE